MVGRNTLTVNAGAMRVMVEHYLNDLVLASEHLVNVTEVRARPAPNDGEFEIDMEPATAE